MFLVKIFLVGVPVLGVIGVLLGLDVRSTNSSPVFGNTVRYTFTVTLLLGILFPPQILRFILLTKLLLFIPVSSCNADGIATLIGLMSLRIFIVPKSDVTSSIPFSSISKVSSN